MFIEFTFANGDTEIVPGLDREYAEQISAGLRSGLDGISFTVPDGGDLDGVHSVVFLMSQVRRVVIGEGEGNGPFTVMGEWDVTVSARESS
ncbi:hypothetical protein SAMN05216298_2453 [Glycomyces sambucus]|uniref:Uncharacterized protein n=1 Tax=Glycomyces sambucus TaxID=380244 RepID=A0A1G9GVR5_9ACTN|nr:hypothetical protein [Glycomyces sambucus]SDL04694.1 hypothetical protein SAMN05216298_2453 [Glycomyces sambucus]